jgi:hypothetical protein
MWSVERTGPWWACRPRGSAGEWNTPTRPITVLLPRSSTVTLLRIRKNVTFFNTTRKTLTTIDLLLYKLVVYSI